MARRVPVHIITGFLGSGKSTLIHSLIAQKPVEETWAILVNEFGQIGIDQAMFEQRDDVAVKGLPGGCLCCQLAFVLQAGLVSLLARTQPDRVIIEPSGLGHPAGLIDLLRSEAFVDSLEVRDIIATLDPRRLDEPRAREHETFQDQLAIADAIAITMHDHSSAEQIDAAHQHANAHWPPRKWVRDVPDGELPIALLLESRAREAESGAIPNAHQAQRSIQGQSGVPSASPSIDGGFFDFPPAPGKPQLDVGTSLGYASIGMRWHPGACFDLDRLAATLGELPLEARIKGVFHTDNGWKRLNRSGGTFQLDSTPWRQDSRLEVIHPSAETIAAEPLLARLNACV
ncbi:GTP-binding protein [Halomonas vilamensis]|uniref:GTP-binding protein n=1 Tax=Vreelandella vilamensis TaxID=531309 RepID=A0ABU1H4T1_9GAMM|nr:GTP-binding protein [Halomonas vilamensis]MDR5898662.1 GTP-binding protein [Halomonas vilamensis]